MSRWRSVKAKQLLATLLRIGWTVAWQNGSHRRLRRPGWINYTFAQKAAANLAKNKVSFEEAATVFGDLLGRIVPDPRHSSEEERYVLLGLSQGQHLLAVMYVDRGEAIRIISARRATRRERRTYEEITQ